MSQQRQPVKQGETKAQRTPEAAQAPVKKGEKGTKPTGEVGGPKGLEPTRYGDWERKGIAVDF